MLYLYCLFSLWFILAHRSGQRMGLKVQSVVREQGDVSRMDTWRGIMYFFVFCHLFQFARSFTRSSFMFRRYIISFSHTSSICSPRRWTTSRFLTAIVMQTTICNRTATDGNHGERPKSVSGCRALRVGDMSRPKRLSVAGTWLRRSCE